MKEKEFNLIKGYVLNAIALSSNAKDEDERERFIDEIVRRIYNKLSETRTKNTKFEENLKIVLTAFGNKSDEELFSKTQGELESYWFYQWEDRESKKQNLYRFYDMLELYSNFCRRWEEHHYGYVCVVERVRDKYLMPKIEAFLSDLKGSREETD